MAVQLLVVVVVVVVVGIGYVEHDRCDCGDEKIKLILKNIKLSFIILSF